MFSTQIISTIKKTEQKMSNMNLTDVHLFTLRDSTWAYNFDLMVQLLSHNETSGRLFDHIQCYINE